MVNGPKKKLKDILMENKCHLTFDCLYSLEGSSNHVHVENLQKKLQVDIKDVNMLIYLNIMINGNVQIKKL